MYKNEVLSQLSNVNSVCIVTRFGNKIIGNPTGASGGKIKILNEISPLYRASAMSRPPRYASERSSAC